MATLPSSMLASKSAARTRRQMRMALTSGCRLVPVAVAAAQRCRTDNGSGGAAAMAFRTASCKAIDSCWCPERL